MRIRSIARVGSSVLLAAVIGSALAACDAHVTAESAPPVEATSRATPANVRVDAPAIDRTQIAPERLEQIAREYSKWGRVDESPHFAMALCSANVPTSVGRVSESADDSTHGGKLYFLYAKDSNAYLNAHLQSLEGAQPDGQVVVKESFRAMTLGPDEKVAPAPPKPFGRALPGTTPPRVPEFAGAIGGGISARDVATKDGKRWRPGDAIGLFVMMRGRADDPDSDHGWRYATMSMDGKTVWTNGRVASCIGCHVAAPHDRLFGLRD